MRLLDDIERRLNNWARWKHGAGSKALGHSAVNWGALGTLVGVGSDRYREARTPTIDEEAEDTDKAVMSLPSELRATVEAHYLGDGSQRRTAARLACSPSSVQTRLARAHLQINEWLHTKKVAREAERARVEAVTRLARP